MIAVKVVSRRDPILGEGIYAVMAGRAERNEALDLLKEYNMIKGGISRVN